MKRMAWTVALTALALAGCGSDSTETATPPLSSTTSVAATPTPTAVALLPAPEITAIPAIPETSATPEPAEAPTAPEPALELPAEATDMPHGEALYVDICQRFLPAIDALESTGAAPREQSVTGMSQQMTSNPSWSTVSPDDQQQILRGLEAAGNGAC